MSQARRNPTAATNAVQTMNTQTANPTLIPARTLVAGTMKTIASTRNLRTERIRKVCEATSVPSFEEGFRLIRVHATPGRCCSIGSSKAKSDHSGCCKPSMNGDEEIRAVGKCIPDGVNGCQRAALLKSTCCGSHANSTPGTASAMLLVNVKLLNANIYRNSSGDARPWVLDGFVGRYLTEGTQVDHSRTFNPSSVFHFELHI